MQGVLPNLFGEATENSSTHKKINPSEAGRVQGRRPKDAFGEVEKTMKILIDTKNLLPNTLILGGIGLVIGLLIFPLTAIFFNNLTPLWSSPLLGALFGVLLWAYERVKVLEK